MSFSIKRLMGAAVCAAALAGPAGTALAQDTRPGGGTGEERRIDVSLLPTEVEPMRDLNNRQVRQVRIAQQQCATDMGGQKSSAYLTDDPCVISTSDRLIEGEEDPALTAFHFALRVHDRYDPFRASMSWRRLLRPEVRAELAES
jgi:hypothetical protein